MHRLEMSVFESPLFAFAHEAHKARFPAMAWKAVACDMMGLPIGSRPTPAQIIGQDNSFTTLWAQLAARFEQMTTVRWAEHVETEEERIHNALTYLGSNVDVVKERLGLMGVMGTVMESCDCPLAHYFGGVYGSWFTMICRDTSEVDFVRCANPSPIDQFVHQHDSEWLPQFDPFAVLSHSA